MRTTKPIRVGVFRDTERARRVVGEALANGFTRIVVVTDDPNVQQNFKNVCDVRGCRDTVQATPAQVSLGSALVGAGLGLVVGFATVFILSRIYGPPGGILNVSIPLAGVVWGAFIGAMVSRGWQTEIGNFYDQELQPDEILVAIEDPDPVRLALAERILRGVGVAPMALPQG